MNTDTQTLKKRIVCHRSPATDEIRLCQRYLPWGAAVLLQSLDKELHHPWVQQSPKNSRSEVTQSLADTKDKADHFQHLLSHGTIKTGSSKPLEGLQTRLSRMLFLQ